MAEIHTHLENESRDCDGKYEHNYIVQRRLEISDLPSNYDRDLLGSGSYDLNFESTDDPAILLYNITASCRTDEGYRHLRAYECDLDCDPDADERHDYTAEAAGY